MRAGLVSAFDVNRSFGLVDSAIRADLRNAEPDLGLVGIRNPLGEGTTVNLLDSAQLIEDWRAEASRQVDRPEMETGWSSDIGIVRGEFDEGLKRVIRDHPIGRCDLTVFAVGVVYLRLEFGPGLDLTFMNGVLACFEFAGYRPLIAQQLRELARARVDESMISGRSEFARLTGRPEPQNHQTANGYEESTILTSFTGLVRCIDAGDDALLSDLLKLLEIPSRKANTLQFEYHGTLYYDWATCVLTPRGSEGWEPDEELQRMEEAIKIAHVFLAACDAFLAMVQGEMNAQVDYYVKERGGGRGPEELNKLRTIALALVNLTNFSRVTQSQEDRNYFDRFARDSSLGETQRLLIESVDVLYNVQEAEAHQDRSKRETVLNAVVIILASLTLISVSADAYNFVRDEEPIIAQRFLRLQLFVEFLLAISLIVTVLVWFLSRPRQRRRGR